MSGFNQMVPFKLAGRPDWRRREYMFEHKNRQHFSASTGPDWELTLLKAWFCKMRAASSERPRAILMLAQSDLHAGMSFHVALKITGCCILWQAQFVMVRSLVATVGADAFPLVVELAQTSTLHDAMPARLVHLVRMTAWPRATAEAMMFSGRGVFARGRWESSVQWYRETGQ
jgi:hypothetical protein